MLPCLNRVAAKSYPYLFIWLYCLQPRRRRPRLLGVCEFHVDELRSSNGCSCNATAFVERTHAHADRCYCHTELPWLSPFGTHRLRCTFGVANSCQNAGTGSDEHDDVQAAVADHVQAPDLRDVEAPHAPFFVYTIRIPRSPLCVLPNKIPSVLHDSHRNVKSNIPAVNILRSYHHSVSNKHHKSDPRAV